MMIAAVCFAVVLVATIAMCYAIAHTDLSDAPPAPLGHVTPRYHVRASRGVDWDSSTVTKHATRKDVR